MKTLLTALFVGLALAGGVDAQPGPVPSPVTSGPAVETIVCIRHGEKPAGGLGQLTCRGLNRALALPDVLLAKFGSPKFVFAPNPTQKVDGNGSYYYVRPLATIEPTAIRCGLPVNTQFGYKEIKGLEGELQKQQYESATVFVAWEHGLLDEFVKDLLKANGENPARVPAWPGTDYDSIFVVRIIHSAAGPSVTFAIDHEGLNNLSEAYPKVAR
ncbi:MAG: hypothetical protein ACLQVX_09890 [Limisphaerales bacterium]